MPPTAPRPADATRGPGDFPAAAHPSGRVGRKEHLAITESGRTSARVGGTCRHAAHLIRAACPRGSRRPARSGPGHQDRQGAGRRSLALWRNRPIVVRLLRPRDLCLPDGRRPAPDRERELPLRCRAPQVLSPSWQDQQDAGYARRPRRLGQWPPHRDLPRRRHGDQHAIERRSDPPRQGAGGAVHGVLANGHLPAAQTGSPDRACADTRSHPDAWPRREPRAKPDRQSESLIQARAVLGARYFARSVGLPRAPRGHHLEHSIEHDDGLAQLPLPHAPAQGVRPWPLRRLDRT